LYNVLLSKICPKTGVPKIWHPSGLPTCMSPIPGAGPEYNLKGILSTRKRLWNVMSV